MRDWLCRTDEEVLIRTGKLHIATSGAKRTGGDDGGSGGDDGFARYLSATASTRAGGSRFVSSPQGSSSTGLAFPSTSSTKNSMNLSSSGSERWPSITQCAASNLRGQWLKINRPTLKVSDAHMKCSLPSVPGPIYISVFQCPFVPHHTSLSSISRTSRVFSSCSHVRVSAAHFVATSLLLEES